LAARSTGPTTPKVEVLAEGFWHTSELRMRTQNQDGFRSANLTKGRQASERRPLIGMMDV
jgi:hypothetical protein